MVPRNLNRRHFYVEKTPVCGDCFLCPVTVSDYRAVVDFTAVLMVADYGNRFDFTAAVFNGHSGNWLDVFGLLPVLESRPLLDLRSVLHGLLLDVFGLANALRDSHST